MACGKVEVLLVRFPEGWGLWRLYGHDHYLCVVLPETQELVSMRHLLEWNALSIEKGPYEISDGDVCWTPRRAFHLEHMEETDETFFSRVVRESAREELAFESVKAKVDRQHVSEGVQYVVIASHPELVAPVALLEHLRAERARLALLREVADRATV